MATTRQVALILNLSKAYDRQIAAGVARYVRSVGHWSLYVEDEPLTRLPELGQWGGDGVIANLDDTKVAALVRRLGLPRVGVGGGFGGYNRRMRTPFVDTDNAAIGRMAADHLIECGCAHLAYCGLRATHTNGWSAARGEAFRERVEAAGHACSVFTGRHTTPRRWRPMMDEMGAWLDRLPKPLGVLAADDQRARHVVEAARRIGARVPADIAIVGVDDDAVLGGLVEPALTSIVQGTDAIGYEAARRLDRLMRGKPVAPLYVAVPPTGLIERASTAPVGFADATVQRALDLIETQMVDRVTVEDVAAACGMSRWTLDARFTDAIGRTVHAEIVRRQIDRVARLLLTTDLSLDRIARLAGFGHVNYMSRVFRRARGLPPGAFRERPSDPAAVAASGTPDASRVDPGKR